MLKELGMKVFISSTFEDLKEYREAAIEVVNRYKGVPLAMEFFMSQPQEPTKACDKEIEECDVFVCIYAHRYGFIPDGETKSITQLEYELAKSSTKPCLCFIVEKTHPWNPCIIEHEKLKELGDFLSALTWVWLHNHILEPGVEIDGVFWWSFYEDPFETFIQKMACYVMVKQESQTLLSTDLPDLQAALHQRRFLLVLDGLERDLRGYSGMEAMYIRERKFQGSEDAETQWEKQQREPVHPLAARFLRHLGSGRGKSRVLITSRLMPVPLEDLEGVKHVFLKGLAPGDGVRFLRGEGVKGTRAELERAGKVYDFHPLMLKLLASSIKRSRTKDVQGAFRLNLIHTKEPHKILTTGFNLLSKKERQVASRLSVFRGVFTFYSAKALFPKIEEDRLWELMAELRGLGVLFYDEKQDRFDFHPIMRSFLYDSLADRTEVHTLAVGYFQPLVKVEKIVSLEDLAPVIELYHHLVKAGKYYEAFVLYRDRII
jgi:hypothetical protein